MVFAEWLASKFYTHKTIDWYTKNALWVYWTKGDDEVELTDEEISNIEYEDGSEMDEKAEIFRIETDLFDFKTPLCKAFNETYNGFKNNWINNWKKGTPWSKDEVPYEEVNHICETCRFKDGKTKWPTCNWNDDGFCNDEKLKEETLKQKAIFEGSWGDATQGVKNFCAWLKKCFDNFHELDYDLLIKLEEYWWRMNDDECSPFTNWRNLTSKTHANHLEADDIPKSDPYLDIYRMFSDTRKDEGETIRDEPELERDNDDDMGYLEDYLIQKDPPYYVDEEEEKSKERRCKLLGIPYVKPPTCKTEKLEVIKYSFGPTEEYVAIKELEHDIWVRTEENVSNNYQDIFHKTNEGWAI
ncbi:hypothetical protein Tco_0488814 [Tanacetum coccineum]